MANTFHDVTVCFRPLAGHVGTHEGGGTVDLGLSEPAWHRPESHKRTVPQERHRS